MLIQSDQDDHAPTETASGVLLAPTMASAVEGTDTTESWYTGRVVQVGPLVGRRDVRRQVAGWLLALEGEGHDVTVKEIALLRQKVEQMRETCPDPVQVGQRVAFSWQAGHQLAMDGVKYVVLRASDVLAVLEEE